MTRTFDGPGGHSEAPGTTWGERAIVLAGFAAAALCTAPAFGLDAGLEGVAGLWLAAAAWAMLSSLALALRRGLRHRDWRAFRRYDMPDSTELIDWSTKSGAWFDMALAEENERLMRGD